MDSEFYLNILEEKCLEINYQESIKWIRFFSLIMILSTKANWQWSL